MTPLEALGEGLSGEGVTGGQDPSPAPPISSDPQWTARHWLRERGTAGKGLLTLYRPHACFPLLGIQAVTSNPFQTGTK